MTKSFDPRLALVLFLQEKWLKIRVLSRFLLQEMSEIVALFAFSSAAKLRRKFDKNDKNDYNDDKIK